MTDKLRRNYLEHPVHDRYLEIGAALTDAFLQREPSDEWLTHDEMQRTERYEANIDELTKRQLRNEFPDELVDDFFLQMSRVKAADERRMRNRRKGTG